MPNENSNAIPGELFLSPSFRIAEKKLSVVYNIYCMYKDFVVELKLFLEQTSRFSHVFKIWC